MSDKRAIAIAHAEAGRRYLGILTIDAEEIVVRNSDIAHFVPNFERKYGKDARVRIVRDWLLEVLNGNGMSYDDFAVLVGIYSKIGHKAGPVLIRQDDIWRRARGLKSAAAAEGEGLDHRASPTLRQVRTSIEALTLRNFFARVTYGRRQTYYSIRMTAGQLSEAVFQLKTRIAKAKQVKNRANATLTRRIQDERRRLAAPPIIDATDPPL